MRGFGFWILFVVVATSLMFLSFNSSSSSSNKSLSFPDMVFPGYKISMMVTTHNRKLKEKMKSYKPSSEEKRENSNNLNMEDYPRIDPAPSSKANIHSGPIEHGSPLMPYIPKPAPPAPTHPKHGASP